MLYYIDVVDACNLRCRTCPRGNGTLKNKEGIMELDLFKRILNKAMDNGAGAFGLYNWTEPFLHPELPEFVHEIRNNNTFCSLSSNLSLKTMPHLVDTLKAGVGYLQVSVSGFTNKVHQVNHRGSDIEIVKKHLQTISDSMTSFEHDIRIEVKYLVFDYNQEEIELFKDYSTKLGLLFWEFPAGGDPQNIPDSLKIQEPTEIKITNNDLIKSRDMYSPSYGCARGLDEVVIDCRGDVYLCCCMPYYDLYKIGNFLELPYRTIMQNRLFHPMCKKCYHPRRNLSVNDVTKISSWMFDENCLTSEPVGQKRGKSKKTVLGRITFWKGKSDEPETQA